MVKGVVGVELPGGLAEVWATHLQVSLPVLWAEVYEEVGVVVALQRVRAGVQQPRRLESRLE